MTGQNKTRWELQTEMQRKSRQSQGDAIWLLKEEDAGTFRVGHRHVVTHRLIEID